MFSHQCRMYDNRSLRPYLNTARRKKLLITNKQNGRFRSVCRGAEEERKKTGRKDCDRREIERLEEEGGECVCVVSVSVSVSVCVSVCVSVRALRSGKKVKKVKKEYIL